MYLMPATRCEISAKQIERETGVTYKTAWRMFKQTRTMLDDEKATPFGGKGGKGVEIDETYIGGKRRGFRGRSTDLARDPKTPVVGVVERKGRVRAYATPDVRRDTVMGIIKRRILPQSTVFTDEYVVYDDLGRHVIQLPSLSCPRLKIFSFSALNTSPLGNRLFVFALRSVQLFSQSFALPGKK
jgi:hypothetical protein